MHRSCPRFSRHPEQIHLIVDKTYASTADLHGRFVIASLGPVLRILQSGTSDIGAIRERLHQLRGISDAAAASASRFQLETDNLKRTMEAYCNTCPCGRSARS